MTTDTDWVLPLPAQDDQTPWARAYKDEDLTLYRAYSESQRRVSSAAALLLIDFYQGPLLDSGEESAAQAELHKAAASATSVAAKLVDEMRGSGMPIVYTTNEDRPEARLRRVTQRRRGSGFDATKAFRIVDDVAPAEGEAIIYKNRASAFFATHLAVLLREQEVSTLVVAGQSTSGCVRASVVDAFSHGFDTIVIEDAVYDRSSVSHQANLFDMHHKYATVLHSSEVLRLLARGQ